jgi:hypothetical protein
MFTYSLESGGESIAYPVYHKGRMAIDLVGIGVRIAWHGIAYPMDREG